MDSVSGMRIFVRVVGAGSFSEAGRQLNVAPSSVSRQIKDLEDSLGARLLQRTTRKLSLTEAGQLYYDRAAQIILEVDEARLAISELGSPSGILRVTVPTGIGRELVVSAIPGFLEQHDQNTFSDVRGSFRRAVRRPLRPGICPRRPISRDESRKERK